MYETEADDESTGIFADNRFHLFGVYRNIRHGESPQDNKSSGFQANRRDADLHADISHRADQFYLPFINQGNKNLFELERANGKPEQLGKRCVCPRHAIKSNLNTFFQSLSFDAFLERGRMPGTPLKISFSAITETQAEG